MIISPDSRFIVSHLGWVDKSALWIYDVNHDDVKLIPVSNAKYLSLHLCNDPDQFVVFHHSDDSHILLTAHSFKNPSVPICSVSYTNDKTFVQGNLDVFRGSPRYYISYYNPGFKPDFYLICVDWILGKIKTDVFDWYDDTYDKMYQGIVGVIELKSGNLVVSIQRDSQPIVYNPKTREVINKLNLASRNGNPKFRLLKTHDELWVDDYDTILKFDSTALNLIKLERLQLSADGTMKFIGDWTFNNDESLCLVPRPFSGDVVAISSDDLKPKFISKTGKQPIQSILVNDKCIIGRDWKTGSLIKGSIRSK